MKVGLALLIGAVLISGACGMDAPEYSAAGQIADALGCSDLSVERAERVLEAGVCEMSGDRVSIYVFKDDTQRDRWLPFGERLSSDLIVGPLWAVDPPTGRRDVVEEALF